jgi:hypothetical protein
VDSNGIKIIRQVLALAGIDRCKTTNQLQTRSNNMATIKVQFHINDKSLVDYFMGCNWEQDPVAREFVKSYEYKYGDTQFPITYYAEPDGKLVTRVLTAQDIADGLSKAIEGGTYHCGEPITADYEDWDACVGTAILQFALYGEEVYA